jgi:hypothetical protein
MVLCKATISNTPSHAPVLRRQRTRATYSGCICKYLPSTNLFPRKASLTIIERKRRKSEEHGKQAPACIICLPSSMQDRYKPIPPPETQKTNITFVNQSRHPITPTVTPPSPHPSPYPSCPPPTPPWHAPRGHDNKRTCTHTQRPCRRAGLTENQQPAGSGCEPLPRRSAIISAHNSHRRSRADKAARRPRARTTADRSRRPRRRAGGWAGGSWRTAAARRRLGSSLWVVGAWRARCLSRWRARGTRWCV